MIWLGGVNGTRVAIRPCLNQLGTEGGSAGPCSFLPAITPPASPRQQFLT
jgi:hypothetical protein